MTKKAFDKIAAGLREAADVAAITSDDFSSDEPYATIARLTRERDEARAALARARGDALEEAARAIEPAGDPPCDCEGNCYCGNYGDVWALADHVAGKSGAAAIRALKAKPA